jgi:hypothetical protein
MIRACIRKRRMRRLTALLTTQVNAQMGLKPWNLPGTR